ncbi:MAG: hypothetical protein WCJ19_04400 [bacterium]
MSKNIHDEWIIRYSVGSKRFVDEIIQKYNNIVNAIEDIKQACSALGFVFYIEKQDRKLSKKK